MPRAGSTRFGVRKYIGQGTDSPVQLGETESELRVVIVYATVHSPLSYGSLSLSVSAKNVCITLDIDRHGNLTRSNDHSHPSA